MSRKYSSGLLRNAWVDNNAAQQLVGPELPPASFSSNVFGTTMASLTGGNPVNSDVGGLRSRVADASGWTSEDASLDR